MSEIDAADAHRAWITAEKIKRVADRLIGLGPFSIGLDGLLAAVPVAGSLFSFGAGVCLVGEGVNARASGFTLSRMIFYVGFRTVASVIPLAGWLVDALFRGHMMAANALQKDIAQRFGEPAPEAIAEARRRPFAPRAALGPAPQAALSPPMAGPMIWAQRLRWENRPMTFPAARKIYSRMTLGRQPERESG